jgi:hypothetical protein
VAVVLIIAGTLTKLIHVPAVVVTHSFLDVVLVVLAAEVLLTTVA